MWKFLKKWLSKSNFAVVNGVTYIKVYDGIISSEACGKCAFFSGARCERPKKLPHDCSDKLYHWSEHHEDDKYQYHKHYDDGSGCKTCCFYDNLTSNCNKDKFGITTKCEPRTSWKRFSL